MKEYSGKGHLDGRQKCFSRPGIRQGKTEGIACVSSGPTKTAKLINKKKKNVYSRKILFILLCPISIQKLQ